MIIKYTCVSISESLVQKGCKEPNSNTRLFEDTTEEILKQLYSSDNESMQ